MIEGPLLLDTNAVVALTENDRNLISTIRHAGELLVALQTVGELVFGALNSARPVQNRLDLEVRLQRFRILYLDRETAEFYGAVCRALRKKGRHIPDNDLWIAALGLQHGLPVVTRDRHFEEVDGLTVVGW